MSIAIPSASLDFASITWGIALREFTFHLEATRARKTVRYYAVQLKELVRWADANEVPFISFGKRHLDRYVAYRSGEGKSRMTLRHDGVCAKAFFAWCAKNDLIGRSPLSEYEVHNAPRPVMHMPTDEEIVLLLQAIPAYWDPERNKGVKFMPPQVRLFHRDRNAAVILGLLDSAARIGEMIGLKVDDYQPKERQITIRESKGKESRVLPVSPEWVDAMEVWTKLRARVMLSVPKEQDEEWLFISDTGGRLEEARFLKTLRRLTRYAGVSDRITLHSLRRFSLNKLTKHNLLMAQIIAGHKETKTTLRYTKLDPDFVRAQHGETGVLRGVVSRKTAPEPTRRKRIV